MDELVDKIIAGELKWHEVEGQTRNDSAIATSVRRAALEKKYGVALSAIGSSVIDWNDAISRNIENPIGAIQIPLGCAGELMVNGNYAKGSYPILLATTEGRLVAGIARGIGVANRAGGVRTAVIRDGMTRDVLLRTSNAQEAAKLAQWIQSDVGIKTLSEGFSKATKHGKLLDVRPYVVGRDLHLRFRAHTGAAMGMNMVTIAAKAAIDSALAVIEREIGVKAVVISESGNLCSDKKPAFINMLEGRGVSVVADMSVPKDVIKERFKVEAEAIAELNRVKNLVGSALAGSHGFNAHVANILAAMYLAHGQDPAQITEGAQAITDVTLLDNGDLYISCYLPALEVGTYGGGTKRETQQEVLKLLGLYGDNDSSGSTRLALAEIIAATCLVGELNLLAVQAAGELSKSHGHIKRG